MKKLLLILTLLALFLASCATTDTSKMTPFERCRVNARKLDIYDYSYAMEESSGRYSCVIPLENSPETLKRIHDEQEQEWQHHQDFLRFLDTHDRK